MKTTKQLLGAVSAFALVAMTSAPAMAEGTTAGSTITNTATVTFNVGGVTQNTQSASDSFIVDQRVNVNVTNVGPATSVAPGQTDRVLVFDVTNLSNSTIDLDLMAALTSPNSPNISNFRIYADANNNGVFDGADVLVTYLDEVGEDDTVRVFVLSDIGLNAVNGDFFDVTLTADAHAGGAVGTQGAELVASGANTPGVDTVLFDDAGATDVANQGDFSATGRYTVAGAVITLLKTSTVLEDPVNGINNPKAIPGATVKYCITVAKASGAATATAVNLSDTLPLDVTFVPNSSFINGNGSCENGALGGTFTPDGGAGGVGDLLTATLNDVPAGGVRSFYFNVLIK